ncbi:MAG: N-acetyltransferase [Chloroflexi bacterium]|nr:MAG: N-acetyltransferase [Chloroflexota bacterium]
MKQMTNEFEVRHLTLADAPSAAAMSASVGWVFSVSAWERMIALSGDGAFALFDGSRVIATACAFVYGRELAWLGTVITHADYQRRGLSRRITTMTMNDALQRGAQRLMLDASEAGYPLYESLGFRPVYQVESWTGTAQPQLTHHDVHVVNPDDIPNIVEYDEQMFGVARPHIIERIIADAKGRSWAMTDGDHLAGFILAQERNDEMYQLGPWVHESDEGASHLLRTALNELRGFQIRLCVPQPNQAAKHIATACGLHHYGTCTRMIYGDDAPPGRMSEQYAIGSYAIG